MNSMQHFSIVLFILFVDFSFYFSETLPEDFFDKSDSRVKPASSFVKPKSILKNKPTAVQDSKLPTTSMPTLGKFY